MSTSSYEVKTKALAAATEAAKLRVLKEGTPAAEEAHREALSRETEHRNHTRR